MERKQADHKRLNALLGLAEAPRCRRQTLLAYFGEEQPSPAATATSAEGAVESFDGTLEAQKILSAVARTGGRWGVEHIVNVLAGDATDALLRAGHDKLKTFGAGKDRPKRAWRSLIRQVYALGLLEMDVSAYGSLAMTERGWGILKGQERVALRSDVLEGPKESAMLRRGAEGSGTVPPGDPLLAALKSLRLELARTEGVPAYVIFTDRSLMEMASLRPVDLYAMRLVHGVGDAKLARYGARFAAVIAKHAAEGAVPLTRAR